MNKKEHVKRAARFAITGAVPVGLFIWAFLVYALEWPINRGFLLYTCVATPFFIGYFVIYLYLKKKLK